MVKDFEPMKNFSFLAFALLAVISCRKDIVPETDDFGTENLIDVCFEAGMGEGEPDSKVSLSDKTLTWDSGDAIGVFFGDTNNSKFTLTSGAGNQSGLFSGQLLAAKYKTIYAYYPYNSALTDMSKLYATLEGQVYDGDYTETGVSSNYRKYAFMTASTGNITIGSDGKWPSGSALTFKHKTGLVRFDLTSSLDKSMQVNNITLTGNGQSLFMLPSYFVFTGAPGYGKVEQIGVDVTTEKGKELILPAGDASAHKYVHMVVLASNFESGGNDIDILVTGYCGGRRVRATIPKHVTSAQKFSVGKRTKVTVPISNSNITYAQTVGISQNGTSLVSPEFYVTNTFEPDITVWGDGTTESYVAGARHIYTSGGSHEVAVSCWGSVTVVTFDNLENITAIDFSKF